MEGEVLRRDSRKGKEKDKPRSRSFQRLEDNNKKKLKQSVLGFSCKKPVRLKLPRAKSPSQNQTKRNHEKPKQISPKDPPLCAPSSEKKCSRYDLRVKNKGVAVKNTAEGLQNSKGSRIHGNKSQHSQVTDSPNVSEPIPGQPKTPKAADFDLPEKYAVLAELFDSMEAAIRLLRLRKRVSSFSNICPQVQTMTHKRLMHSHVAQMKHILPEGMLLEKIMSHDEKTLCMNPDLKITLLYDALPCCEDGQVASSISEANTSLLRKTFHTRLMEFAMVNPQIDEVPEEILPEPFNKKCQLTPGFSVPPIVFKSISPPRGAAASSLSDHQGDPQPSIMPFLLPSGFRRSFSQKFLAAQPSLESSSGVSEKDQNVNPSKPTEATVANGSTWSFSCTITSHFPSGSKSCFASKLCCPRNTQATEELNDSDEVECKSSTCNETQVTPISKPQCITKTSMSDQIPCKIPDAMPVAEVAGVARTPCKTALVPNNPSSTSKGCFSVTLGDTSDSIALKITSGVSSPCTTPVPKSVLKSNVKNPICKKSFCFGNVSTTADTLSPVLSPGTPGFASPKLSDFSQSSVRKSGKANVRRAIAFNRSVKDASVSPVCKKPPIHSTSLKRKAEEANLDDALVENFQSTWPPMPSTPSKSRGMDDLMDSVKQSSSRAAVNPFAISKNDKVMQSTLCSLQSPIKAFNLKKNENENTLVKGFPGTPPCHAPKRYRFSADENITVQVKETQPSSQTCLTCSPSPKKKSNAGSRKLDFDKVRNVSIRLGNPSVCCGSCRSRPTGEVEEQLQFATP